MKTLKCNVTGILYVLEGKYKLAKKGLSVGVPHEITLNDEEFNHPEIQQALQRGWLVPAGESRTITPPPPPPKPAPEVEKCEHGFPKTEICDYCNGGKTETPEPDIIKKLTEEDKMSEEQPPKEERRGRRRKDF